MADGAGLTSRLDRITIDEAARRLSVSTKRVRNLLSEHREQFRGRAYGRVGRGYRRRRLLSRRDLGVLGRLMSLSERSAETSSSPL